MHDTHYRKLGLSGLVVLAQRVLCTAQREELGSLGRRSLEKSSFRLLETWEEEAAVTDSCTYWSLIPKHSTFLIWQKDDFSIV